MLDEKRYDRACDALRQVAEESVDKNGALPTMAAVCTLFCTGITSMFEVDPDVALMYLAAVTDKIEEAVMPDNTKKGV